MSLIQDRIKLDFPPRLVYRALTTADEQAEITGFEAQISPDEGGAFSLFGGRIVGRNIELVPDKRIVQAFRSIQWPEGVYSILRIDLVADGESTLLSLHHEGVPEEGREAAEHQWRLRYWEPLRQHLELFHP